MIRVGGWIVCFCLCAGSLAAFPPDSSRRPAAFPEKATVTGSVYWKGKGKPRLAGQEVLLEIFRQGQSQAELKGKLNAGGKVRFTGQATSADYAYLLQYRYQEVVYSSALTPFPPGAGELNLEIAAYPTTRRPVPLQVPFAHLVVVPPAEREEFIVCRLNLVLENKGEETWVPDPQSRQPWLAVPLPEEAQQISVDGEFPDGVVSSVGDEIHLAMPLPPGPVRLVASFELPIRGGSAEVRIPKPLPGGSWLLITEAGDLSFAGAGVRQLGQQKVFADRLFTVAEWPEVGPGINFRIAGLKQGRWAARHLALFLLLPLAGLAFYLDRRYKKAGERGPE